MICKTKHLFPSIRLFNGLGNHMCQFLVQIKMLMRYFFRRASVLTHRWLLFSFLIVVLTSCSTSRYAPKDSILLKKNKITIDAPFTTFTKSDLDVLLNQKATKGILGIRLGLWAYYVTEAKKDKKAWKWVHNKLGNQPVYYNEQSSRITTQQMSRYLQNLGYFNNEVKFETKIIKNKTAIVHYKIKASVPFRLNDISYSISDSTILSYVTNSRNESIIQKGDIYNAYKFDYERDRITNHLRSNGYYFFTKDFIQYEVDSNQTTGLINVNVKINPVRTANIEADRKSKIRPFERYFIHQVKVFPNHRPFATVQQPYDTILFMAQTDIALKKTPLYFLTHGDAGILPKTFNQIIQIKQDDPFSINQLRQTYKGLTNLKIFRASNITFDTVSVAPKPNESPKNYLNCNIYLQRGMLHAYAIEVEGTNSGGDLGIRGSLVYSNNNLFKGAELLRVRLNGGFEAQHIAASDIGNPSSSPSIFNVSESGMDATIFFPRFLSPIRIRNFVKDFQPKTNLNVGFNSQKRLNYERFILKSSFGYEWRSSMTVNHVLTPINLNSVKVNPSDAFKKILDELVNQRFKDQYSNHLIFSLRYSFIFNNQNVNKLKDFFYYRINFESSGNLLSAFNKTSLFSLKNNYKELFGIRYSQFIRLDQDFRYYRILNPDNKFVFRAVIGFGLPYGNSYDLPFERSYYAGGANGMRGWQYRGLGPGSFSSALNVERIGDMQLETNVEYRFPIYSFVKGAVFADVGNIWTINEKDYLKGGVFKLDQFHKELAVDAGLGLRFDFSFFVFRLDMAVPLHDPARIAGDRWRINKLQIKQLVYNFGIGYPF